MKILRGSRQSGKTTELIKRANKEWKYIICLNRNRADIIARMAFNMGIDIPFPITVAELKLRSPFITSVLVDDLEDILEGIIGKPVDFATTSCEIEEVKFKEKKEDNHGANNG